MNDDGLTGQIRKFLKQVGITSQRAIEQAVNDARAKGTLTGKDRIVATMTLSAPDIGLHHVIETTLEVD